MSNIAPHITDNEYRCSCCGLLPPGFNINDPKYAFLFQDFWQIRTAWGKPLKISSGYRCPAHNKAIGGSYLSVHMFGLALDLDCAPDEVEDLFTTVLSINPDLRIGKYTISGSFVHIDSGYLITPIASIHWIKGKRWYK